KMNLIDKIENINSNIPCCYRCKNIIEHRLEFQWFILMNKMNKKLIEQIENNEINFIQKSRANELLSFLKEGRDWCISRQLTYGHQLPVYYCKYDHINVSYL